ncbi:MAG TPA: hypothetical protein VGO80_07465 [Solirubrobacteraceae bacterium]|jgi:hypothetical protein|nr:hypothetical protein [Solirubrobacteraceae bacterium]
MCPPRRISLLAVLLALGLAACGGEATKGLATLKGDGFSVSMPGTPKRTVQSVPISDGTIKAISYTSDSHDKAFSIGYTQLPEGVRGDLHGAIRGGAANVGGRVRDERTTSYQGFTARDARITGAADNKGTLFVRAILAKGRLYLLQFIGDGPNLEQAPPAYSKIIASLKID